MKKKKRKLKLCLIDLGHKIKFHTNEIIEFDVLIFMFCCWNSSNNKLQKHKTYKKNTHKRDRMIVVVKR